MLFVLLVTMSILTIFVILGAIFHEIERELVLVSVVVTLFTLFLNLLVSVNNHISLIEPQSVLKCDVSGLTTVTYKMGDKFKSLASDMASIYLADKNGIVVEEVIKLNIFGMEIDKNYRVIIKE